jgi:hypothetical protein
MLKISTIVQDRINGEDGISGEDSTTIDDSNDNG